MWPAIGGGSIVWRSFDVDLGIPGFGDAIFYTALKRCLADSDMPRRGGSFYPPNGDVVTGGDDNWITQNTGGIICL